MRYRRIILMKILFTLLAANMIAISAYSQTNNMKSVTVEINNVIKNGGTVHVTVFLNENAYKKRNPDYTFKVAPSSETVKTEISIPFGNCLIFVYQDTNGNGKFDTNIIGIPKEPVGITNWNGKGHPGSFDKYKVSITKAAQTISINLNPF